MPHQRKRQLLALIEKRLRLFPITGVLGARQIGKSTLMRELLPELRTIRYITLDRDENRQRALQSPTLFIQSLESNEIQTVCIDEVQKAPVLFDTLKAEVDELKRPGRFAISGSTEFSKKTGIHESLTGRIALLRMFPLNLCEISATKPSFPIACLPAPKKTTNSSLKSIHLWLEQGGMPGIFAIRDEINRRAMFDAWIETTCTRDLAQFNIPHFNPELARRILQATARCEVPTRIEIAKKVGKTSRQIQNYLDALQTLFVLYEVSPHPTSTGKAQYYLFDAGVANALGADEKRRLQIWFLNECLSQFSYSGKPRPFIFFYSSSKGSKVDFVIEADQTTVAVLLSQQESPSTYSLRAAEAFQKKNPSIPVLIAAPCLNAHRINSNIQILPWGAFT